MEQGINGPTTAAPPTERFIERVEWNGYTLEAEYDWRHIYGPQFKVTYLTLSRDGKWFHPKQASIEPLLAKGFDIRSGLRYLLDNAKATLEMVVSGQ
jgi:hypothetical protein